MTSTRPMAASNHRRRRCGLATTRPAAPATAGGGSPGANLRRGATIVSARVEVNAAATQWISLQYEVGADNTGNSAPAFGHRAPVWMRALAAPRIAHASNEAWVGGTPHAIDGLAPLAQAVICCADGAPLNSLQYLCRARHRAARGPEVRVLSRSRRRHGPAARHHLQRATAVSGARRWVPGLRCQSGGSMTGGQWVDGKPGRGRSGCRLALGCSKKDPPGVRFGLGGGIGWATQRAIGASTRSGRRAAPDTSGPGGR